MREKTLKNRFYSKIFENIQKKNKIFLKLGTSSIKYSSQTNNIKDISNSRKILGIQPKYIGRTVDNRTPDYFVFTQ